MKVDLKGASSLIQCDKQKMNSEVSSFNKTSSTSSSSSSMKSSSTSSSTSSSSSSSSKKFTPPENWVNAPEFVPKNFTAAAAYQGGQTSTTNNSTTTTTTTSSNLLSSSSSSSQSTSSDVPSTTRSYAQVVGEDSETNLQGRESGSLEELCPYATVGECRYGDQCVLLHGNKCDYCGQFCLHPYDPVQREKHTRECIQQHEQDMELSFAIARSSDKSCGICMEVVMEKSPAGEQRFGILPSCNHCYCLSCLRKWRQAREFENKICRSCPECRVTSDFICPSRFWVEGKEEKEQLINSYKSALSKKACRYYKNGTGECPFGNKCFYLHALPNGAKVDVGPPRRKPKRLQADGQEVAQPPGSSIWDFLYDWELQWLDVEDFMDIFSSDFEEESEDDEGSEFPSFYL